MNGPGHCRCNSSRRIEGIRQGVAQRPPTQDYNARGTRLHY